MKKVLFLLLGISMMLVTGCSQRIGDFTVISTRNVDIGKNYVKVKTQDMGVSMKPMIFIIPMGTPSMKDAVDDLLRKNDGELVGNCVIHSSWWWIPYIYGEFKYEITGDVYKQVEKAAANLDKSNVSEDAVSDLNEAGKVFRAEQVNGELHLVEINKDEVNADAKTGELKINI